MSTIDKPPLPTRFDEPFQRVEVDQSKEGAFGTVLRLATFAADMWAMGPEGPYKSPGQTPAEIARGQVREAILHLLELGLIDIDEERLGTDRWWPTARESARET